MTVITQDTWGDTVSLTSVGATHFLTIDADGGEAALDDEQAIKIADALYEATGNDPGPRVKADSITFNEGLLRLAAIHEVEVSFAYAKGDGAVIEHRRLVPGEVKTFQNHQTFFGYDPDRDDVRAFRVDRIRGQVYV